MGIATHAGEAWGNVASAVRRHAGELAITAGGGVVGASLLLVVSREFGLVILAAFAAGGPISIAYTEQSFREQQRQTEERERADAAAGLAEMRTIAELARAIVLDVTMWTAILDWKGRWDSEAPNPPKTESPPPEWSIAAIVARGRASLKPMEIRGWSQMAQLIRDHAAYLVSRIDQEFPGPPAERRSELTSLFRATDKAAEGADELARTTQRLSELYYGDDTHGTERTREFVNAAADSFFGACEWVQGCVERLDDRESFSQSIAQTADRHRSAAAAVTAAAREVHAIATNEASRLLVTAGPSPEHLARSTLGRADATLRDVANAEHFAFASDDEPAAVEAWLQRIPPAQRSFHLAVLDRGGDMNEATHFAWTRVHNDSLLELERSLQRLRDDLHARAGATSSLVDGVEENVSQARRDVSDSVRQLVSRIGELGRLQVS